MQTKMLAKGIDWTFHDEQIKPGMLVVVTNHVQRQTPIFVTIVGLRNR
jgi:hypothetical protein